MKLFKWISSATLKLLDPKREQRVMALAEQAWKGIAEKRDKFDLEKMLLDAQGNTDDIELVAEKTYEIGLRRAWKDGVITDREQASLRLLCKLLKLDPKRHHDATLRVGKAQFQNALGHALADGYISSEEVARLNAIAATLGATMRELMQAHFAEQGEGFLRNLFAQMMQNGVFSGEEWNKLVKTATRLGFTEPELQTFIRPQAQRLVEHVLADAKSDESISDQERRTIRWLLDTFKLPPEVRSYVEREIELVDMMERLRSGRLPAVQVTGVVLRAGEICHYQARALYVQTRQLKNGPVVEHHHGEIVITDYRMLFSSPTRSVEVVHRRIISLFAEEGQVELRTGGKGSGTYIFPRGDRFGPLIYETAVGKANQTIVERVEGKPSRHIPRDVRQRVWQRYGGRCAECGDDHYLEFDHIVPVAKGGSNSDNNVQLLCRACNAKKSDMI